MTLAGSSGSVLFGQNAFYFLSVMPDVYMSVQRWHFLMAFNMLVFLYLYITLTAKRTPGEKDAAPHPLTATGRVPACRRAPVMCGDVTPWPGAGKPHAHACLPACPGSTQDLESHHPRWTGQVLLRLPRMLVAPKDPSGSSVLVTSPLAVCVAHEPRSTTSFPGASGIHSLGGDPE